MKCPPTNPRQLQVSVAIAIACTVAVVCAFVYNLYAPHIFASDDSDTELQRDRGYRPEPRPTTTF